MAIPTLKFVDSIFKKTVCHLLEHTWVSLQSLCQLYGCISICGNGVPFGNRKDDCYFHFLCINPGGSCLASRVCVCLAEAGESVVAAMGECQFPCPRICSQFPPDLQPALHMCIRQVRLPVRCFLVPLVPVVFTTREKSGRTGGLQSCLHDSLSTVVNPVLGSSEELARLPVS